jgi:hypothetical protein
MSTGTWVCDSCNTNNAADKHICRRCGRPAGSTTSTGVHKVPRADTRPRKPTETSRTRLWSPESAKEPTPPRASRVRHSGSGPPRAAPSGGTRRAAPPTSARLAASKKSERHHEPASPGTGSPPPTPWLTPRETVFSHGTPPTPPPPSPSPTRTSPPPRGGMGWLIFLVLAVLAIIIFSAIADAHNGHTGMGTGAGAETSTVASPPSASPAPMTPRQKLAITRDTDHSTIESTLVGYWVPQLASNKPGVDAKGRSWDDEQVWDEHALLKRQFGALLLNSNDYVFKYSDYWVSLAPTGFSTSDEALAWCRSQGRDNDHCYAAFITHDASIPDTVEYQH